MATGVVSIALAEHGYGVASTILAVLATAALPMLAVFGLAVWRRAPLNLTDPDVTTKLFTFVAACAVLDARLIDLPGALWTLAVIALAVWLLLVVLNTRAMTACSWGELQARARGAWELPSVGTSGLAIVITALSAFAGSQVLLDVAATMWTLAIVAYGVMTSLILGRAFAARLDPSGFEPDAWILMGGLAIATLAGDRINHHADGWLAEVSRWGSDALWIAATLWLPPLLYFAVRQLRWPPTLRFSGVWWAMVFPLGMYAVTTHAMATDTNWAGLTALSAVSFWVAVCAWVTVAMAGLCVLVRRAEPMFG